MNGSTQDHASEQTHLLRPDTTHKSTTPEEEAHLRHDESVSESISIIRATCLSFSFFVLIFVLTCNISAIATITSPIAVELNAYSSVSWFATIYLIALTSLLPLTGKLSEILTPRVYLLISVLIQAVGLFVTSSAKTLAVFLVGRVITGIGGAAITPVALIMVTRLSSIKRRALFFGCINTCYTIGVSFGAILAGAVEARFGWRAFFLGLVPFSLVAVVIAFFAIPPQAVLLKEERETSILRKLAKLDYFGLTFLISTIVLFLYGVSSTKIQIIPIALSVAAAVVFVLIESYWAADPVIPPSVLKHRGNMLSGLATLGNMTARWSILFYAPVYAIAVRGWSQTAAGFLLIPTNAGFAIGGLLVGAFHIKKSKSFYFSSIIAYILFAVTHFTVSQISTPDFPITVYILVIFLNGLCTGALLNYTLAHLLHLTHPSTHTVVIPLNVMFRGLSGSFGGALAGGIFLRSLDTSLKEGFAKRGLLHEDNLIHQLLGTPRLVQQLTGTEHLVAQESYGNAIRVLFMAGSGLALAMVLVQAGTGWTAPEEKSETSDAAKSPISRVSTEEAVAG